MLTPPNSTLNSNSSFDLLKRITQRLQQRKVENQLLETLQQVFDQELDQGHIIISRPERIRLFRQATKAVLTEMLAKIDRDK